MSRSEEAAATAGMLRRASGPTNRPAGGQLRGMDVNSGADLALIDSYLQQLLPALAKANKGAAAATGSSGDSMGQLGISREALLAAGLPQHTINALYRAMAAHAGAFRKMVAGEVKQLRSLLAQQAAPQLSPTIQFLDGPIASATGGAGGGTAPLHAAAKGAKAGGVDSAGRLPALAAAAAAAAGGGGSNDAHDAHDSSAAADVEGCSDTGLAPGSLSSMADSLSCLGPTANELVKDYAEAYASMKENMEIRLRHEQRRGDFLQDKLQQTEGTLKEIVSQLDAAHRRIAEQQSDHDALSAQHAELQQSLAVSHAAHLALQQHHTAQMEAWQVERQEVEQQHKQQLETLQKELSSSSAAAAALVESNRQGEALRMLYNEELGRASTLAVELTKATAAADKAAAQEAMWAKQIATSDGRADNAEGMAAAMDVSVRQLEAQLRQRQQEVEAKEADGMRLRLMLERSRLTAVAEAAAARANKLSLNKQLQEGQSQLKERTAALTTASDQLKLCKMELEGANAQLQAGRSHMKQLMSDLEVEQEKCAGLAAALDVAKDQVATATSAAEVAEARLKSTQEQLGKANDAAVTAQDQVYQLQAEVEELTAAREALQLSLDTTSQQRDALESEAGQLKARLSELVTVQQELAELWVEHGAVTSRVAQLEEEHEVLSAKAEQLLVTTFELQELQQQHSSLREQLEAAQHQLSSASQDLTEAQAAERASGAQVHELQEQLDAANLAKGQLARELLATSAAGDSAQHELTTLAQQLDDMQSALEAAEMDRQALAAQRDGWMSSFQEAYGKLQEWTVSSEAAARKLATRAGALQGAMQSITSQAQASAAAEDGRAAAGSTHTDTAAGTTADASSSSSAAAAAAAGASSPSAAAATSEVMDQLAGLQQLVRAEAHKQQEVFDNTLKALHDRVQERHHAAQASWQETMAAANARRAARAAAKAAERARKKQSLVAMAAANSHAAKVAAAVMGGGSDQAVTPDVGLLLPGSAVGGVGDSTSGGGAGTQACEKQRAPLALQPPDHQQQQQQQQQDQQQSLHQQLQEQLSPLPPQQQQQLQALQQQQLPSQQAQQQPNAQYLQLLQQHQALQHQHHLLLRHVQQQHAQAQPPAPLQHQHQQQQPEQFQSIQQLAHVQQSQQAVSAVNGSSHLQSGQAFNQQQTQHSVQPPELVEPHDYAADSRVDAPSSVAAAAVAAGDNTAAPAASLQPQAGSRTQSAKLSDCSGASEAAAAVDCQAPQQSSCAASSTQPSFDINPAGVASGACAGHVGTSDHTACVPAADSAYDTDTAPFRGSSNSSSITGVDDARATSAGASSAVDDGSATVVQRVSSAHRVTQTTTVTVITTSTSIEDVSAEQSTSAVHGGGGSGSSSRNLAVSTSSHHQSSSSEQTLTFTGTEQQQGSSDEVPATPALPAAVATAAATASDICAQPTAGDSALAQAASEPHGFRSEPTLQAIASGGTAASVFPVAATGGAAALGLAPLDSPLGCCAGAALASNSISPEDEFACSISSPSGLSLTPPTYGSFGSFGSSSSDHANSPGGYGGIGGGAGMGAGTSLSGFVSLATYQEQMQSVAKLHGQVGQLAVQLREAHADADGAQQMLQQERQEAVTRTTALREALGQLHGQLEELREDHKQLQESHRTLMTKDLMNSGLLRDRYVADLFERLQEALWKLDTARKRAATWGFDMLVPLGRTNRGIQTQAGEIWAATAAVSSSSQAATRSMTAIAAQGAAGASTATAVLVTTTSSRSSSSSRTFRMLAASGGDLSAEADPEAAAARLLAGHNSTTSTSRPSKQSAVPRKIPAFTQHDSSSKNTSGSKRKTGSATVTDTSAASSAVQMPEQQLLAAAARVLSGAESAQVVMPVGDLLKLVASLYSSKAAADARALRSHSQPLSMWAFVCRQLLGPAAGLSTDNSGSGRDGASPRGSPTSTEASEAMVQLLGSLKAHAAANKEVAAFQAALVGSMPRPRSATESRSRSGSRSTTPTGGPAGGSLRGTWGDLRLDDSKLLPAVTPDVLLACDVPSLVQQVLAWPGMSALIGWISGGHFLGGLGPDALGRALLDVQAPHIHFLLLEAADILQLHPLPKVYVLQAPTPFVRLLRIPLGSSPSSSSSSGGVLKCQRASVLVLSSAAMQLLAPAELQAAMSGALAPLALEDTPDDAAMNDNSSSSSSTAAGASSSATATAAAVLADLATLSSLLAIAPAFLLGHLPGEMHAMGGFLAAALLAVERLVAAVGDRASLLVCQDVGVALSTLLKTSAASGSSSASAGGGGVESAGGGGSDLVQQWQQRLLEVEQQNGLPSIGQLLPQHHRLAAAAATSKEAGELSDEQVLQLRVHGLLSWSQSQQYAGLMADARPLRRLVRPGSANSSRHAADRVKSA